jgi:hypothetical protein
MPNKAHGRRRTCTWPVLVRPTILLCVVLATWQARRRVTDHGSLRDTPLPLPRPLRSDPQRQRRHAYAGCHAPHPSPPERAPQANARPAGSTPGPDSRSIPSSCLLAWSRSHLPRLQPSIIHPSSVRRVTEARQTLARRRPKNVSRPSTTPPTRTAGPIRHRRSHQSFGRRSPWGPPSDNASSMDPHDDRFESAKAGAVAGSQNDGRAPSDARDSSTYRVHT